MDVRDRYLSTTQGGYSQPTSPPVSTGTPNFGPPGQGGNNLRPVVPTVPVVDTTSDPVANVSTGTGSDDLKVQAQQARAAEEKQKYIDKLKGYAASMSSSPGLYGSLYGPGAEEMFDPRLDPTLDDDPEKEGVQSNLYNLEDT